FTGAGPSAFSGLRWPVGHRAVGEGGGVGRPGGRERGHVEARGPGYSGGRSADVWWSVRWRAASVRAWERARRAGPDQPQSQRARQKEPRSVVET
ncbi:hypothetical protein ACWHIR_11985, partial [Streptomyces celluloflavus]